MFQDINKIENQHRSRTTNKEIEIISNLKQLSNLLLLK